MTNISMFDPQTTITNNEASTHMSKIKDELESLSNEIEKVKRNSYRYNQ